ncbi:MAG: hypothetical protein ACJ76Z_01280 [Thermoleophilaceae bacterium]
MARVLAIALAAAVVGGCGGGGLQGTLAWQGQPQASSNAAGGRVRNTTSHAVDLNPKTMRLLDADGRKVAARFQVGSSRLPAHALTSLRVRWRAGKPVRIDYGQGTLAIPSG